MRKKLWISERILSTVHLSSTITLCRSNILNKKNTDLTIIIITIGGGSSIVVATLSLLLLLLICISKNYRMKSTYFIYIYIKFNLSASIVYEKAFLTEQIKSVTKRLAKRITRQSRK